MRKLVLPFIFTGLALSATAGGLDEADTSDEASAEPAMEAAEVVVEEPSSGGGGWGAILILLIIAGLAL